MDESVRLGILILIKFTLACSDNPKAPKWNLQNKDKITKEALLLAHETLHEGI